MPGRPNGGVVSPALSHALAGATRLLRRGEAGRAAAVAPLVEAGRTPDEAAAAVADLLERRPRPRRIG